MLQKHGFLSAFLHLFSIFTLKWYNENENVELIRHQSFAWKSFVHLLYLFWYMEGVFIFSFSFAENIFAENFE